MFKKIPSANENNREVDINQQQFHQPPSPPTGIEQFFLPSISTSNISAFHLAQTIRENNKISSRESNVSEAISDFQSCASVSIDPEDNYQREVLQDFEDVLTPSTSGKSEDEEEQPEEVLTIVSEESIEPLTLFEPSVEAKENESSLINKIEPTMPANKKQSKTKPTTTKVDNPVTTETKTTIDVPTKTETMPKVDPSPKVEIPTKPSEPTPKNPAEVEVPTPIVPTKTSTPVTPPKDDEEKKTDDEPHFDVTQHVYEGFKNVWGFGSNIIVVKPFLKLTEGVAGTVLGLTTGMKLENVDQGIIKPKLAEFDNGLINPAISKIVGIVMPIFETGDSVVKGVVPKLLGPFGFGRPVPTIAMQAPMETKEEEKKPLSETKEKEDEVDMESSEETVCTDEAIDPRASTRRTKSSRKLSHKRSNSEALPVKMTRKSSIGESSTTTTTSAPPLSPLSPSPKKFDRNDQLRTFRALSFGEGSNTTATIQPSFSSHRLSSSSRKTSPFFSRTMSRTDSMGSLTTMSVSTTDSHSKCSKSTANSLDDFSRSHESRLKVYMEDMEASIRSFDNVGGAKQDESRENNSTRRTLPARESSSRNRSRSGAFPLQITLKRANDESSTTATTSDYSIPARDGLSSSSLKTVDLDDRRRSHRKSSSKEQGWDNIASWVDGLKARRIKAAGRSKSISDINSGGGSSSRKQRPNSLSSLKSNKLLNMFGSHQKMLMNGRMTPEEGEDEYRRTSGKQSPPLIVAFPVKKRSSERSSKSKSKSFRK